MKSQLFLIVVFSYASIAIAQPPKEIVYLYFDSTLEKKCVIETKNKEQVTPKKFRKDNSEGTIIFNICWEKFVFVKNWTSPDTLSNKQAESIKYSSIDYLINKYRDSESKLFKHNLIDTIYIIEKFSNNKFKKYRVGWTDERLGWID